jgi:hypothetical protein
MQRGAWLAVHHTNSQSWQIMNYAIRIAHDADRRLSILLLLSGDTHHYSRYDAEDGTQFVKGMKVAPKNRGPSGETGRVAE